MKLFWYLLDLLTSQWIRISGESMLPTLRDGQWVRASRVTLRRRSPQRFDVVRFEAPVDGLRFDVKRVVGLPWEEIELRDGALYVDGRAVDSEITGGGDAKWSTGEAEYVMLGDNRAHSTDSRRYGVVNRRALRGTIKAAGRQDENGH